MQNVQVARTCHESKDVSIKVQLIIAGSSLENILMNENVILPELIQKYRNISMVRFLWTLVYIKAKHIKTLAH